MTKLKGQKFGKLTVTGKSETRHANPSNPNSHSQYVEVICDCGVVKWVNRPGLTKGESTHCGCETKRCKYITSAPEHVILYHTWLRLKHRACEVFKSWLENWDTFAGWSFNNGYKPGLYLTRKDITQPLEPSNTFYGTSEEYYSTLRKVKPPKEPKQPSLRMQYPELAIKITNIKIRCNPNYINKRTKCYSQKGITVCDEWATSTDNFILWALDNGYEKGLTIERKNNDLGYYPDNCTFIPKSEQMWNICRNVNLTAFGETKHISAWARDDRLENISIGKIKNRLKKGMSFEDIVEIFSKKYLQETNT